MNILLSHTYIKKMGIKNILKRFFYLVIVLLGLSLIIFVMARIMPGDTVRMSFGSDVPEWVVQRAIEERHYNEPIYKQYFYWFTGMLRGDFGTSWVTRRPVLEDIKIFFPASAELITYSMILTVFLGLLLGAFMAWNSNNHLLDSIYRIISYTGISVPPFIFAIFLLVIFSMILKIFPSIGMLSQGVIPPPKITHFITIDALLAGNFFIFFDALKHLFIPVISLSLKPIVQVSRLIRAGVLENIDKGYITAAKSFGIPDNIIMYKYVLKPSIIPTVSYFGLDGVSLFVHAFIIENIFNWPGISRYGMVALLNKDLDSIITVVLIVGLLYVLSSIVVDTINRWLDPRISIKESL